MSWTKISDQLPELNKQVYLCEEEDPHHWISEGRLEENFLDRDECPGDFAFDGAGWFLPQPTSSFTHWMYKTIPTHVDIKQ